MSDRRSRKYLFGALALICATTLGCREDFDYTKKTSSEDANRDNIQTDNNVKGSDLARRLPEICRNSEKCMTSSECVGDAAYIACRCVVDRLCTENPQCNGIKDSAPGSDYDCNYTCGTGDTCNWNVCASTKVCEELDTGECTLLRAQKNPEGDEDKDGITNEKEIDAGWDPCLEDSDGDGVPDGQEDLNGDGQIDRLLGETDPGDASDHPDTVSGESAARAGVCKAETMLKSNLYKTFNSVNMALFEDVPESSYESYSPAQSNGLYMFSDAKTGVNGLYFRSEALYEGNTIMNQAFSGYSAVEKVGSTSNFENKVPLPDWLKGSYDTNLQVVPDHTIMRTTYTVSIDPQKTTPKMLRNKIAKAMITDASIANAIPDVAYSASEACSGSEVTINLARSFYDEWETSGKSSTIYEFGIVCKDKLSSVQATNYMDDIISGTMVAPASYVPFRRFVCQTKSYGDSSGMIDFIWMVDNSGSMVDEQDNVSKTAQAFVDRLGDTGIDYRIGVAFTDAYLLDESPAENYYGYHLDDNVPNSENMRYVSENGLRYAGSQAFGFLTPTSSESVGIVGALSSTRLPQTFISEIRDAMFASSQPIVSCDRSADFEGASTDYVGKNVCGYGYEDGLKSVEYVLKSLSIPPRSVVKQILNFKAWSTVDEACKDEDASKRPTTCNNSFAGTCYVPEDLCSACYLEEDSDVNRTACYDQLMAYYKKYNLDKCYSRMDQIKLRDGALKYIIWVSDEMSRQFKEAEQFTLKNPSFLTNARTNTEVYKEAPICLTGYKINRNDNITDFMGEPWEMFSTTYGPCYQNDDCTGSGKDEVCHSCNTLPDGNGERVACNPSLKIDISERGSDKKLPINETTVLPELQGTKYNEQYNVIMHYITSYLKYAGKGGIAGFAIVGDDSSENGGEGSCKPLPDGSPNGADYGYDYILTARYLGAIQKYSNDMYIDQDGNFNFGGKLGGYGSICNDEFDDIVDNLMSDAIGRVASHNLKGYPISSTIQVAVKNVGNPTAKVLTRGAKLDGWSYDASQNSIILSGVNGTTSESYLAIAYVIWTKDEG